MRALKESNPEHVFWGLGGDHMISEGLESLYHVKDLSVTGFVEVLKHLSFFRRVMRDVVKACAIIRVMSVCVQYPIFFSPKKEVVFT